MEIPEIIRQRISAYVEEKNKRMLRDMHLILFGVKKEEEYFTIDAEGYGSYKGHKIGDVEEQFKK